MKDIGIWMISYGKYIGNIKVVNEFKCFFIATSDKKFSPLHSNMLSFPPYH